MNKTLWHGREQLVHQIVTRARQGQSWRSISRSLGVSRNTVKNVCKAHQVQRDADQSQLLPPKKRAPRPSKLDGHRHRISELLDKYPDITAQRVFETLREKGFTGGATAVKKAVRKMRPPPKPNPSLQTPDWGPGKMAESDWSPYEITFTTGLTQKVQLFSYVLVHSRRKFYQAYDSYDVHALMAGHVEAFSRFGGCAEVCKYDGQKAVVLRWEGPQPIYNPRFLAFCTHYEMRPWAIRGNPNARPRVERGFWEHEKSFLNGREFRDIDDFRGQLAHWLDTIVDLRTRNRTTALQRFEQEAPALTALPRHPYDTARVIYRLCSIEGFVDWKGNHYAVPYDHVTDWLPVRITQHELFVYAADLQCIARHELAPRGGGHQLDPEGFHRRRAGQAAVDLDQLREAYRRMGDRSTRFFAALSADPPRRWSHPARQILLLRQHYATEDLDAALGHAASFGALSFDSVERILQARHRVRSLDEYVAEQTAQRIENLVGGQARCRDLNEYDRLSCAASNPHPQNPADSAQESTAWPNEPHPPSDDSPKPMPPDPVAAQTTQAPMITRSPVDCEDTSTSSD